MYSTPLKGSKAVDQTPCDRRETPTPYTRPMIAVASPNFVHVFFASHCVMGDGPPPSPALAQIEESKYLAVSLGKIAVVPFAGIVLPPAARRRTVRQAGRGRKGRKRGGPGFKCLNRSLPTFVNTWIPANGMRRSLMTQGRRPPSQPQR